MSASIEIFSKVNSYLAHQISLWDLESWLAPRLPMLMDNPESQAGQLAGIAELCLAELSAGIRTERSIRTILSKHSRPRPIVYVRLSSDSAETITTSSGSVLNLIAPQWDRPSQAWSNELRVVTA